MQAAAQAAPFYDAIFEMCSCSWLCSEFAGFLSEAPRHYPDGVWLCKPRWSHHRCVILLANLRLVTSERSYQLTSWALIAPSPLMAASTAAAMTSRHSALLGLKPQLHATCTGRQCQFSGLLQLCMAVARHSRASQALTRSDMGGHQPKTGRNPCEASPPHASVSMQSLLDEACFPADARHEPVRHLVCPLPGWAPHLHAWLSSSAVGWALVHHRQLWPRGSAGIAV